MRRILCLLGAASFFFVAGCTAAPAADGAGATAAASAPAPQGQAIAPYQPRFGRSRPVAAVIGENRYTELSDYVVPYGVLSQSGAAEVVAVATREGPMQMFPAFKIQPQATTAAFDARYPDGADYVIVPAVHYDDDPQLLGWIAAQARKGATVVGICDGVWVVGKAGLLKGRRATGHWYAFDDLRKEFKDTTWVRNRRYVVDGPVVTTTGLSASIPVSLALVEAIAGRDRAQQVAAELGVPDWNVAHDSERFKLGARTVWTIAKNWVAFWSHEDLGLPVAAGVDEITAALVADVYSSTFRSQTFSVAASPGPVRTRRGLVLLPDRVSGGDKAPDRMLAAPGDTPPVRALQRALDDIATRYGQPTAAWVSLKIEHHRD
ncbi:DJ-1/PfpI family protein [Eleftheria terrae]|uniref:DJ-1/PfpI family protein n=1 Tax=Eleftheria terrae TaxID=1597781 RepID=UPI00263B7603|nr:DJ-1/PfpI family protein [Eleftheria terrae]WKB54003.1 DJ-1/PfpI family protein [Eleftheria terrae]